MVVKLYREETFKDMGEEDFYNLRRHALSKNIKNKIYDIVDNRCELCGKTRAELGDNDSLHIHHIKKIEDFGPYEDPNTRDNIVVLCNKCHTFAHRENNVGVLKAVVEHRQNKLTINSELCDIFDTDVYQYIVAKTPPAIEIDESPIQIPLTEDSTFEPPPYQRRPPAVKDRYDPDADFIGQLDRLGKNKETPKEDKQADSVPEIAVESKPEAPPDVAKPDKPFEPDNGTKSRDSKIPGYLVKAGIIIVALAFVGLVLYGLYLLVMYIIAQIIIILNQYWLAIGFGIIVVIAMIVGALGRR